MACVLTIFKESLLLCSHFSRQVSYALTTVLISSMLLEENDIVESSAYIAHCALLRASGRLYKAKIRKAPGRALAVPYTNCCCI